MNGFALTGPHLQLKHTSIISASSSNSHFFNKRDPCSHHLWHRSPHLWHGNDDVGISNLCEQLCAHPQNVVTSKYWPVYCICKYWPVYCADDNDRWWQRPGRVESFVDRLLPSPTLSVVDHIVVQQTEDTRWWCWRWLTARSSQLPWSSWSSQNLLVCHFNYWILPLSLNDFWNFYEFGLLKRFG